MTGSPLRLRAAKTCVDVSLSGGMSEKRTYRWNGVTGRCDEEVSQAITTEKARKILVPETFSQNE
jgi:hypothetical protein